MHQSGQLRAQSMQTVQFSSLRAMTPRERGASSSFSCGYCTVTAGLVSVLNVTPRPLNRPPKGGTSEHHLEDARGEDVHQRDGDEELPRQSLELVLTEPGEGEPDPEDHEGDRHHLSEQHQRSDE